MNDLYLYRIVFVGFSDKERSTRNGCFNGSFVWYREVIKVLARSLKASNKNSDEAKSLIAQTVSKVSAKSPLKHKGYSSLTTNSV